MDELVLRSKKVSYMETTADEFERMIGFTALTTNKNPEEYTRKYVDEDHETTDIIGMSTAMEYEFDQMKGNKVHDGIIEITDKEMLGKEAVKDIVVVDFTTLDDVENTADAVKRSFTVVPESDGDGTEAYRYTGSFRVKSGRVEGTVTTTDDWETVKFDDGSVLSNYSNKTSKEKIKEDSDKK